MTEYSITDCPTDAPHELSASARQPQLRTPPSALPTPSVPQPSTLNSQPLFPRSPGETPRAYNAFNTFFQLGQARSHQSVADTLGENLGTIKNWSSRFDWSGRLHAFYSGLLQHQLQTQAETQTRIAADWALRLDRFREQEWDAAQKLLLAAQCFLESFGEDDLRRMTLAQVSRALRISSAIGRLALAGASLPESSDAALSPAQHQLLDAINRVYGVGRVPEVGRAVPSAPSPGERALPSTLNSHPSTSHD